MESIWQWGLEIIIAIQTVHNPVLDVLFNVITLLGSEEFYLLLLPLLYWCIDKRLARRLAFVFLFSVYLNAALKSLFRHPRPFQYDARVLKLDGVPARQLGYGLPSGHTQLTFTVWGYLALQARRAWVTALALAMMMLVPFSRMYLGVHFPSDVLGGALVAVMGLGLFSWFEPRLSPRLARWPVGAQIGLALAVPLVLLLFHSSRDATAAMGTLMGMGAGFVIEARRLRFSTSGPLGQRAARFLVGLLGVVILREGLKLLFPAESEALYTLFRTLRYGLVGLWAAWLGPWVFLKLGLAGRV